MPKLLELPAAVTLAEKVPDVADNAAIVVLPKLFELPLAVILALDDIAPDEIVPAKVAFPVLDAILNLSVLPPVEKIIFDWLLIAKSLAAEVAIICPPVSTNWMPPLKVEPSINLILLLAVGLTSISPPKLI